MSHHVFLSYYVIVLCNMIHPYSVFSIQQVNLPNISNPPIFHIHTFSLIIRSSLQKRSNCARILTLPSFLFIFLLLSFPFFSRFIIIFTSLSTSKVNLYPILLPFFFTQEVKLCQNSYPILIPIHIFIIIFFILM